MRYGNKTRLPAQVSLWGKPDGPWWETYKQRSVGFVSVTVSNDSVAHVKGAWTQIFASISSDVDFISINGQISGSNLDTATL
jgi:ribosomal protein L3